MSERKFQTLQEIRRAYFPNAVQSELTVEEAAQECAKRLLINFSEEIREGKKKEC